jgi:uncharacterized protein (TIGR00299 family) protein
MILASGLPAPVKRDSVLVFRKLAEAEGAIHNVPPEEVHFHEVGAVDSIVDTVGVVLALHLLGVERVFSSELPFSQGMVKTQHGLLPVPAPATAKVLSGTGAVFRPSTLRGELVTPTGASLLAALCGDKGFGPPPPFQLEAIGHGAGTKEFAEQPNVLRVILGRETTAAVAPVGPAAAWQAKAHYATDELVQLECNIDDMEGEIVGYARECLLRRETCLDCWVVPVQMKKNRPGLTLCVLCHACDADALCGIMFKETSTLGIRRVPCSRVRLDRRFETVDTAHGQVRIKLGIDPICGAVVNASPEYEECKMMALASGTPLKVIYAAAKAAALDFWMASSGVVQQEVATEVSKGVVVGAVEAKLALSSFSNTRASASAGMKPAQRRSAGKAREAEDSDVAYRHRMVLLEERMRASFLASLSRGGGEGDGDASVGIGDVADGATATATATATVFDFKGKAPSNSRGETSADFAVPTTISKKAQISTKRCQKKAAEAEDSDAGYRGRMAMLEERMRASLLKTLSEQKSI